MKTNIATCIQLFHMIFCSIRNTVFVINHNILSKIDRQHQQLQRGKYMETVLKQPNMKYLRSFGNDLLEFIISILYFCLLNISFMKIRTHIKDAEKAQQFCCNICLDVCLKPARCAGPCKTLFCMKCIIQWTKVQDQTCPLKCSNQLLKLTPVDDLIIDFYCPFNKQKCAIPIKSVKEFLDHYKVCKEIDEKQYKELCYKNEFKCNVGHPLEFYIGQAIEVQYLYCTNCDEKKSSRAVCRQCSQFFCVDCRKPPCSKKGCPNGHQFKFHKKAPSYICDLCDCPIHLLNISLYEDKNCNFGLCEPCYKNAPQQLQCKVLQNNPQLCKNNHKLLYVKEVQIKKCQLCKKEIPCSKYCEQCKQYYCLQCKIPYLIKDMRCPEKHTYILEDNLDHSKFCMKCFNKQQNVFHYESVCNIRLCNECFNYLDNIRLGKSRPINYNFCPKGHSLSCLVGQQPKYMCSICFNMRNIKMFCDSCHYTYCQKCLPPSNPGQCYLDHQLKHLKIQFCTRCDKIQPEMMGWKCDDDLIECSYQICQKCKEQLQQKYNEENKQQKVN